jgi:putative ABC transport system substrate-binding protein
VKRREFIGLVGGAAAWPLTASAQQQGKIVTIGILASEPWPPIETFRRALDDLGYIEGKNVRFECRYTKGDNERFSELANELVGLNIDVILTWGTDAVLAAKQATATIPIVMGAIGDPIGSGVVTNLAHPGGNITGCSSRAVELEAKRLQLLKEVVPGLSRVAIIFNRANHYAPLALQSAREGAQTLHVILLTYDVYDAATGAPALHRPAAWRRYPNGTAARPRRRSICRAREDRRRTRDPGAPRTRDHHRIGTERPPDILGDKIRPAVRGFGV